MPRQSPLLPANSIGALARFSFNVLTLCLIYGTIARTTSASTIGSYWFEIVGNVVVVVVSYLTATLLGLIIKIKNPLDFDSLRIAASFPNIVALPILIFPALCEYPVVYEAFGGTYARCVDESTSKIFAYFLSWSFLFWTFGQSKLMAAANQRLKDSTLAATTAAAQPSAAAETIIMGDTGEPSIPIDGLEIQDHEEVTAVRKWAFWMKTRDSLAHTFLSPGFLAMILGFITGCIPFLQQALFSQGGALRFIGAAIDTMGTASSSISTIVVAASLVPNNVAVADGVANSEDDRVAAESQVPDPAVTLESPIMSDPNFGPRRRASIRNVTSVVRRRSSMLLESIRRSDRDMMRLHVWFFLSRLILAPAVVSGGIAALDCAGALGAVSNLSKLVMIINSALPGALIVVVLLKSQPALSESAAVVAKIYLSSYLLSIVPIAAWTSVGLFLSVPREDGKSFCGQ